MRGQEGHPSRLALLGCLASLCVASVKGFATQTAWTTQTLESISLADNPSPQGPISEQERPTTTHGITEDAPYFVSPPLSSVRTRLGRPAVLTCVVKHLGNRQVSWIRGRDLHVLSYGQVTFSSDARLSVSHSEDSWTLTIKFSQPRDAGAYSCQVNTQPPQAVWYNLTVIEARANILGKETLYLQSGSTISLQCVIKEQLAIPVSVLRKILFVVGYVQYLGGSVYCGRSGALVSGRPFSGATVIEDKSDHESNQRHYQYSDCGGCEATGLRQLLVLAFCWPT
ncbi:uncharacterized protein LOC135108452 isoform X2 [Scylla paramamosain]|uniref:uncharacterized protein LOC135108452 isoform X2 n=1 Tax=Scylla paramamosain TaxID=85552 RepID=UPI003083A153